MTDRRAVDRIFRPLVIGSAAAFLLSATAGPLVGAFLSLAGAASEEARTLVSIAMPVLWAFMLLGPTLLAIGGALGLHQWGLQRGLRDRVVVDDGGIRIEVGAGTIRVPWHAARGLRLGGRPSRPTLTLEVADGPDVVADVPARMRRSMATKGVAIAVPGIAPGAAEIAAALQHASGGRLQAR